MASYLELKAQAEKLLQQAEDLRQQEVAEVIKEIKAKMAEYGITTADLGASSKKAASKASPVVKYRGPNGEEWSGRGRSPVWMKEALEQGKSKEDFAV
ncbi:H-NS family nucleoid-associated regulatory protein [Paracandidimonas soli]|uniref:DNA-binding protein H-NS n=1 Tax=Paracandidimonas soli TaxID=1917182 RepID=A0A4R3UUV7_9BURK|nr:H-NS histone family protein [Paracandidimonas soli]TCU94507.1 DNA-binding protein H-NS [Paracandidimonas soli]